MMDGSHLLRPVSLFEERGSDSRLKAEKQHRYPGSSEGVNSSHQPARGRQSNGCRCLRALCGLTASFYPDPFMQNRELH